MGKELDLDWPKLLTAWGDQIVNPKCDDCGRLLDLSPYVAVRGPHECSECRATREREQEAQRRDWLSQERPRGRTIHKMPKLDW